MRYYSSRAMHEGGHVQMGTILVEPVLNRLQRCVG
jgi:hypothetical protein